MKRHMADLICLLFDGVVDDAGTYYNFAAIIMYDASCLSEVTGHSGQYYIINHLYFSVLCLSYCVRVYI